MNDQTKALLNCAMDDASEIAEEALQTHLTNLGETTPKNKNHADWLRACIGEFSKAKAAIETIT